MLYYIISQRKKNNHLQLIQEQLMNKNIALQNRDSQLQNLYTESNKAYEELNKFGLINQKIRDILKDNIKILKLDKTDSLKRNTIIKSLEDIFELLDEGHGEHSNNNRQLLELKSKIRKEFPDISTNDEKLCILLRINYTIKDISTHMGISPKSVEMARYRLRKKYNIESTKLLMDKIKEL